MGDAGSLISFVAALSGEGNLRVEENLGDGYVRLRVSEAERRQAKHDIQHVEDIVIELLRNARDAGASNIFLATNREEGMRTIVALDDGAGIPPDMHEHVFEARVTSKLDTMSTDRWGVHGRGMALFSIRQNAREAAVVASGEGMGTSIRVVVDTDEVGERSDQSSWPQLERDGEGNLVCVRGPHNIVRTCCEFALDERQTCDVYLGSPADIAATLYEHGRSNTDAARLLFLDSEASIGVALRLACAADAADFMRIASGIGLDISERTAHRIFAGQIKPLRSVSSRLLRSKRSQPSSTRPRDLSKDARGLRIAPEDLDELSRSVERDFADIAAKYYLYLQGEPKLKVRRDQIVITLDIGKEEC